MLLYIKLSERFKTCYRVVVKVSKCCFGIFWVGPHVDPTLYQQQVLLRIEMRDSTAEAKTATASQLSKLEPHIQQSPALLTLGVYLLIDSDALDTIGFFGAGDPLILQEYCAYRRATKSGRLF
jgi:hypothetical protein